ncbi:MAG: enoyl-CoA hydratase [Thermoplasmatales archaeon]|nr:enoyl-CoA hydratase [Thermoplasmatales archaeon]
MKSVLFEKKGHVGIITLNRPEDRNALSLELMDEMQKQLDLIAKDRNTRVIVIRGNGPAFCTGHNINELVGEEYDIEHFRNVFSVCSNLMQTLQKMPQPIIAQVHGAALAAGCQLVAACDLAIADNKTKFSTPGVKIGLFCSTPMVPLSRVIGRRRALDMLLTGRFVSAQEAEKFGLINKIAEPENLSKETENWAEEIAKFSLFTLELGKKAFYHQTDLDEDSAYDYAKEAIANNCLSEDAQEGMKAFLEKRKPEWKDR